MKYVPKLGVGLGLTEQLTGTRVNEFISFNSYGNQTKLQNAMSCLACLLTFADLCLKVGHPKNAHALFDHFYIDLAINIAFPMFIRFGTISIRRIHALLCFGSSCTGSKIMTDGSTIINNLLVIFLGNLNHLWLVVGPPL